VEGLLALASNAKLVEKVVCTTDIGEGKLQLIKPFDGWQTHREEILYL
jgi:hypothetical protein